MRRPAARGTPMSSAPLTCLGVVRSGPAHEAPWSAPAMHGDVATDDDHPADGGGLDPEPDRRSARGGEAQGQFVDVAADGVGHDRAVVGGRRSAAGISHVPCRVVGREPDEHARRRRYGQLGDGSLEGSQQWPAHAQLSARCRSASREPGTGRELDACAHSLRSRTPGLKSGGLAGANSRDSCRRGACGEASGRRGGGSSVLVAGRYRGRPGAGSGHTSSYKSG